MTWIDILKAVAVFALVGAGVWALIEWRTDKRNGGGDA